MERHPWFGTGPGQANVPALRELLQDVVSKNGEIKDLEIDQDFPRVGLRHLVLNARQIETTQLDTPKAILIAIEDFTERKRVEMEAEKSQSAIRALLEASSQSIVAVDSDGMIMLANGNTERMFGYRREELVGQPLDTLIPELIRTRQANHRRAYFTDLQNRPMSDGLTLEGRRKDGAAFPIEVALSAIETAEGKLGVAFVSDITQRRGLEQAAQAHSREVRALAASLLTVQEEERRKVSRELHDQICQQLASLAIEIGGLAADPPPPEEAQPRLRALQARVVKASEETRHIAYELHSSVLDDLGLAASLRSLCEEFSRRPGNAKLKFTHGDLPSAMPRAVASCLYRFAQESLNNIEKHAQAQHVVVALSFKETTLVLAIADDGVGFDQEAIKGRGGLGLIGMGERARLVNGELSIETRPGHGTRIAMEVRLLGSNV